MASLNQRGSSRSRFEPVIAFGNLQLGYRTDQTITPHRSASGPRLAQSMNSVYCGHVTTRVDSPVCWLFIAGWMVSFHDFEIHPLARPTVFLPDQPVGYQDLQHVLTGR